MSRSRYEPVPQTPQDEIIDLSTITNTHPRPPPGYPPSYNYNSGVPTSPPPSFHSSQSIASFPDLDRSSTNTPTPTTGASIIHSGPAGAAGAATSIIAPTVTQVQDLHFRIERLEETIGRLLLEKESRPNSADASSSTALAPPSSDTSTGYRQNCCVTFSLDEDSDSSENIRALISRSHDNCCVRFEGRRRERTARELWPLLAAVLAIGLMGVLLGWWIVALKKAGRGAGVGGA